MSRGSEGARIGSAGGGRGVPGRRGSVLPVPRRTPPPQVCGRCPGPLRNDSVVARYCAARPGAESEGRCCRERGARPERLLGYGAGMRGRGGTGGERGCTGPGAHRRGTGGARAGGARAGGGAGTHWGCGGVHKGVGGHIGGGCLGWVQEGA